MYYSFKDCLQHLYGYTENITPCHEKIIEIYKWIYSSCSTERTEFEVTSGIVSYPVREPGVRFCRTNSPGIDHFFCVVYQKQCVCLKFYRSMTYKESKMPPYMRPQDNRNWVRINGEDVNELSIETLKSHIRDAYRDRFDECFPDLALHNTKN